MVTGATRTQSHTTSQGESVTGDGKFVGRTPIKCEYGHMQIGYSTWCEGRRRLFVLFLARFSRCSARSPQSETGGTEVFPKLSATDTSRGVKTAGAKSQGYQSGNRRKEGDHWDLFLVRLLAQAKSHPNHSLRNGPEQRKAFRDHDGRVEAFGRRGNQIVI